MSQLPPEIQLEYSFLRLPYEYSVKLFKIQRRQTEQDITKVMKAILQIQQNANIDSKEAQIQLNAMISQLGALKQRLNQGYVDLDYCDAQMRKRIQYLQHLELNGETKCVHEIRLLKCIIDWLMRKGHFKSAFRMMKMNGMEDYAEMEFRLIKESYQILQDMKQQQTKEALKWCSANRTRLHKQGSSFEFQLILQEYIEMLRVGKVAEGLSYLKKSIAKQEQPFKYFGELQKAMGCLAFLNKRDNPFYSYYFEKERWEDLTQNFKLEMQNIYALKIDSSLEVNLQVGLSTLKTIYCSMKEFQRPSVCPLCNKMMESMVYKIPSTQKSESTWICRITGEIMDEHNPPLILPNNQVYSTKVAYLQQLKALQKLAGKSNGKVICPITKDEFLLSEATRVYLS